MDRIAQVTASAFRIPTDGLESDGTFEWTSTTIVIVEVAGGGERGLGYTYAHAAAATLINDTLAPVVTGMDVGAVTAAWVAMGRAVRNIGRAGLASCAIAAVDVALWDLHARRHGVPLATLLGRSADAVPVYGSGGFTSYSDQQLSDQFGRWVAEGITRVKMKIGREPARDPHRVRVAREAIGPATELFVDANGALTRKQALGAAESFVPHDVCWFEEPVSSDDLEGLRLLRDRAPARIDIAAGEYGYTLPYFRGMLEAGAVDVLQADATRCGGISGFLRVAALAETFGIPLSAHTAPSLHVHPCAAANGVRHIEYFHDHARIEQMLFDGAPRPVHGMLAPDREAPGLGLTLKRVDAARFAA